MHRHYDAAYKDSRKLVAQAFRSLINSHLGNILAFELDEVERCLDMKQGEPTDVSLLVKRVVTNAITQILYSRRFEDHGG